MSDYPLRQWLWLGFHVMVAFLMIWSAVAFLRKRDGRALALLAGALLYAPFSIAAQVIHPLAQHFRWKTHDPLTGKNWLFAVQDSLWGAACVGSLIFHFALVLTALASRGGARRIAELETLLRERLDSGE